MHKAQPLLRLPTMGLRLVVLAAIVRPTLGQSDRPTMASAAFTTSMQCMVSLRNMIYNEDWRFLNNTHMRWCRVVLENKMSTCCQMAEFAKGMADSCSDCKADCVHTQMTDMCNSHFGKACKLTRKPFSKNNISMQVTETFCVPSACDNPDDLKNNLLVKWFDAQYRYERTALWMYDYADSEELECPSMLVTVILSVVGAILAIIIAIPLFIFLFKAPKERGRVLKSAEDDHEEDEDTLAAIDN